MAGSITAGGFIQGSLTGLAGGFSSGFVGCSGNAWLSGSGFGSGLKAGLIGGAIKGAIQAVTQGLIRGFTDMAKGYSFWDGSKYYNFTLTSEDISKIAEMYDTSHSEFNDISLKDRMYH